MALSSGRPQLSAILAVAAAFIWATYYIFVLSVGSAPAAILTWPFLAAGLVFLALAAYEGRVREFVALFRSPMAYVRSALLIGMQVSVLASTYVAGPVDTSLLSLVGDAALTPVLLIALYREGADRARSPFFLGGLALSIAGATLTILGGNAVETVHGVGWLVAPTVPITVAFYFLLSARASLTTPLSGIVGQSMLVAGVGTLLLSPLLPGGAPGLGVGSARDALLLVGLGLTSFFLADVFYFKAIELAGIFLPALLMATIPVFTLLVAVLVLGQSSTWLALAGIPIAVGGGLLALRGSHAAWTPSYEGAGP
ncbi:MAG: DMT family transporter [Thermoplasmata archaeon]|nr:DMT family transporter [Thermoplasmata archaeon]MCI4354079.1 DMT family transporter [Thermoplasmata archaeon]